MRKLRGLDLASDCNNSAQNLFSSFLLPKNVNVKIQKTINLPYSVVWCETWSLRLREEYRFKLFKNRALRRMFEPMKDEVI
jgi:hypothetical protein